jgi:hypothetical protein
MALNERYLLLFCITTPFREVFTVAVTLKFKLLQKKIGCNLTAMQFGLFFKGKLSHAVCHCGFKREISA